MYKYGGITKGLDNLFKVRQSYFISVAALETACLLVLD